MSSVTFCIALRGAMSFAACSGTLGEAALAVLVATGHLSLSVAALADLRTISRQMHDLITGHMPGSLHHKLISRPDRIQVQAAGCRALSRSTGRLQNRAASRLCVQLQQVQALRRLAGVHIEHLCADIRFTPFLHLLPKLRRLELQTRDIAPGVIGSTFDMGSLIALTSLSALELKGGKFNLDHLEKLTQLSSLSLIKWRTEDSGPFCQLPCALTRLDMEVYVWSPAKHTYLSPLLHFQGQLRSLTIGKHDMNHLGNDLAKLISLGCMQQLTHLQFELLGGELTGCIDLNLPNLQSLHARFGFWPDGPYPHWQLAGCPELRRMTLLYFDDEESEQEAVDLRGIHGCQVASLHLQLHLPYFVRAVAAFHKWRLETVSIEHDCPDLAPPHNRKSWPKSQSVQGILSCLAGHVTGNVTVNDEQFSDQAVQQCN